MHYLLFNHESFVAVMSIRSCSVRVSTMGCVMVVFVIFSKKIFTNRVYLDLLIVCVLKRTGLQIQKACRIWCRVSADRNFRLTAFFFFSFVERSLYMSSPHRPRNSSSLSVLERERVREKERMNEVVLCTFVMTNTFNETPSIPPM